ncbi:hypothetical protein NDU88_006348 [Pleurodeles waltl]|uniref:Uncharacterized protein n=2 Tax=Pleurodeles waltl TaxID=8319 RepID=A0AAV7SP99_PLEWA|nr:hypothetical protein NDU88_006348 [Pleurodeles waltl]
MAVLKPFGFRILRRCPVPSVNISGHYLKKSRSKKGTEPEQESQRPPKEWVKMTTENHLENTDNEALRAWLREKKILLRREGTAQRKQKRLEREKEKEKAKERQQKEEMSEREVRRWMERKVMEKALSRRFLEGLSLSIPTHTRQGALENMPCTTGARNRQPNAGSMITSVEDLHTHTTAMPRATSTVKGRTQSLSGPTRPMLPLADTVNVYGKSLYEKSEVTPLAEGVVNDITVGDTETPTGSTLQAGSVENINQRDLRQDIRLSPPSVRKVQDSQEGCEGLAERTLSVRATDKDSQENCKNGIKTAWHKMDINIESGKKLTGSERFGNIDITTENSQKWPSFLSSRITNSNNKKCNKFSSPTPPGKDNVDDSAQHNGLAMLTLSAKEKGRSCTVDSKKLLRKAASDSVCDNDTNMFVKKSSKERTHPEKVACSSVTLSGTETEQNIWDQDLDVIKHLEVDDRKITSPLMAL